MNTSNLIPYNAVAPIIMCNEENILFYSGTGFFVRFLPYESVFFITTKHCIMSNDDLEFGRICIFAKHIDGCKDLVSFLDEHFIGKTDKSEHFEDVIIFIVDKDDKNYDIIKSRAIRLIHQNDIDKILNTVISNNNYKLRTVGFPATPKKQIDYDINLATYQARGFFGDSISLEGNMYSMKNLNWKDNGGDLNGFSGSPVIDFLPTQEPIPVGIIATGGNGIARFISINIATNLIASYLKTKNIKIEN